MNVCPSPVPNLPRKRILYTALPGRKDNKKKKKGGESKQRAAPETDFRFPGPAFLRNFERMGKADILGAHPQHQLVIAGMGAELELVVPKGELPFAQAKHIKLFP